MAGVKPMPTDLAMPSLSMAYSSAWRMRDVTPHGSRVGGVHLHHQDRSAEVPQNEVRVALQLLGADEGHLVGAIDLSGLQGHRHGVRVAEDRGSRSRPGTATAGPERPYPSSSGSSRAPWTWSGVKDLSMKAPVPTGLVSSHSAPFSWKAVGENTAQDFRPMKVSTWLVHLLEVDLDRVVVDHFDRFHEGEVRRWSRRTRGRATGRRATGARWSGERRPSSSAGHRQGSAEVEIPAELGRRGVEIGPIVELHTFAQVEDVGRLVGRQFPALCELGGEHIGLIGGVEHHFQEQALKELVRPEDLRGKTEPGRVRNGAGLHDAAHDRLTGSRSRFGAGSRCGRTRGGRCATRGGLGATRRSRCGGLVAAAGGHGRDQADDQRRYEHQPDSLPHYFPSSCIALPHSASEGRGASYSRYSLARALLPPPSLLSRYASRQDT